jgi:hypothetical protein
LENSEESLKAKTFDWSEFNGKLADIKTQAEDCRDEEQEYYDNMPESIQSGDKGDNAQSAVSAMETAIDALDTIDGMDDEERAGDIESLTDKLGEARDGLNDAAGY